MWFLLPLAALAHLSTAAAETRRDEIDRKARVASGPGPIVYTREGVKGGTRGCYRLGIANELDDIRKSSTARYNTEFNRAMLLNGVCNEYVKRIKMLVVDRYASRKLIKVKPADGSGSGRELWVYEDQVDLK